MLPAPPSSLVAVIASRPLTSALLLFVAFCTFASYLRDRLAGTKLSAADADANTSREAGLARARELQQQRLEDVCAQRRAAATPAHAAGQPTTAAQSTIDERSNRSGESQSKSRPKPADDPNSYTARLARLEKGKGDSGKNPLLGHESGAFFSHSNPFFHTCHTPLFVL